MRYLTCLLLLGCANVESVGPNLTEFNESVETIVTGCSWRHGETTWTPRDSHECWHVYTGKRARLSTFQLANICDAEKLDTCISLKGTESLFSYYDYDETPKFSIIRNEKTEPQADGSCLPCEDN